MISVMLLNKYFMIFVKLLRSYNDNIDIPGFKQKLSHCWYLLNESAMKHQLRKTHQKIKNKFQVERKGCNNIFFKYG